MLSTASNVIQIVPQRLSGELIVEVSQGFSCCCCCCCCCCYCDCYCCCYCDLCYCCSSCCYSEDHNQILLLQRNGTTYNARTVGNSLQLLKSGQIMMFRLAMCFSVSHVGKS